MVYAVCSEQLIFKRNTDVSSYAECRIRKDFSWNPDLTFQVIPDSGPDPIPVPDASQNQTFLRRQLCKNCKINLKCLTFGLQYSFTNLLLTKYLPIGNL